MGKESEKKGEVGWRRKRYKEKRDGRKMDRGK